MGKKTRLKGGISMKADLAILYEDVLKAERPVRLVVARGGILRVHAYLTYKGFSPMSKMSLIDTIAHCPLAIDGPINEEEVEYLETALHIKTSVEEANRHVKDLNERMDTQKALFEFLSKLAEVGEMDVRASLLRAIFIGLISDSGDDMNEAEEKYFEELLFAM